MCVDDQVAEDIINQSLILESIQTTSAPISFQSPAPKSGRLYATWDIGVEDPSMLVSALKEQSFLRADEMYDIINRFQGEKVTLKMDNPGTIPKAFKKMYDEGTLEDGSMSSSVIRCAHQFANQTSLDFLCQIGIHRNDPKLCYCMTEFTGKLDEDIRGIGAAMERDLRKVGINDTYDLFALARRVDNTEEFMVAIDPTRKFRRNAITAFHCVAELLDFAATEIYGLDLTSSELRPWVDPVSIAAENQAILAEKKAANEKVAAEKKAADDRWWKEGDIVEFNNDIDVLISINEKRLQLEKSYVEKFFPRSVTMNYKHDDVARRRDGWQCVSRLDELRKIKSANPKPTRRNWNVSQDGHNKQYVVKRVIKVDSRIEHGIEGSTNTWNTNYVGQAEYDLKAVDDKVAVYCYGSKFAFGHSVTCSHHELTAPFNKDPVIENTIMTSRLDRNGNVQSYTQWGTMEEAYKVHGDKLKKKEERQ